MRYSIIRTNGFKKDLKLLRKQRRDLTELESVIDTLAAGERLDRKYHDHELKGRWQGFRECHISPDHLLIYLIDNGAIVLSLIRTGTHSELFGM